MEAGKVEQIGVVRFLVAEGAGTREVHRCRSTVRGEHTVSLTSVHAWQKRFREGRPTLQDDSRSGQAHRAITPDAIVRIGGLIRKKPTNHRNKFTLRSALAISPCMPWSKITYNSGKFARNGFGINWRRDKRLTEWLHIWVICSGNTRKNMLFCHVSSQGTKHGATILSPRVNGKANNGNTSFSPAKEIQSCPYEYRCIVTMISFFDCRSPLLVDFLEQGSSTFWVRGTIYMYFIQSCGPQSLQITKSWIYWTSS